MNRVLMQLRALSQGMILIGIISVTGILGPLILPVFGPDVEQTFFPVFTQLPEREVVYRGLDGTTLIEVWVDKHESRIECEYRSQRFLVNGQVVEFERLGVRPRPGASRPPGVQSFGWYTFATDPSTPAGSEIKGVVRYECHRWWYTPAKLGPWIVPPMPKEKP